MTSPGMALHEHALKLVDAKLYQQAMDAWLLLSARYPRIAALALHIGQCAERLGIYHAAREAYWKATRIHLADPQQPDAARAWFGLGGCLFRLGKPDEGRDAWITGLEHDATSAQARFQRSLVLLALGRYAEGWACYEARKELRGYRDGLTARGVPEELPPAWDGQAQGRVLVIGTQGNGDVIQFSRYLPIVEERSEAIPRAVFGPELAPWLGHSSGGPCQWSVDIDSLPHVLGMPEPIAPDVAYETWGKPRGGLYRTPVVGVCWKGSPHHGNDFDRSSPLSFLEAFTDQRWSVVSLQQGEGAHFPNYYATVQAISQLDAVVTVDTSVAHVAGTLGVPTIVIPQCLPDYRWGISGDATPWYPSVRIVRRQRYDDWPGAIAKAKRQLDELP